MSFPSLLKKLFTNNGAGDKLNASLLPADLSGVPVGTIISYAGKAIPDGWLLCNGSNVSIELYPELYAAIGTVFGHNSKTTFALPDLVDKYVCGAARAGTDSEDDEAEDDSDVAVQIADPSNPDLRTAVGAVKAAGLPNVTASVECANAVVWQNPSGSFFTTGNTYSLPQAAANTTSAPFVLNLDASRSSSIYGNSTTVTPPSVPMFYIIKY